ncbi:MAG TPA: (d)CMP kinase, partial [Burkholderiales bacterium]|nr:(d)CMP kinase [Burkholderiales bacterium]
MAKGVAQALQFHYLDSGALYRLAALAALDRGVDLERELEVADIARNINVNLDFNAIQLEGRDVADQIRSEAVGAAASQIAALPKVREALLGRQRA